MTGTSSTRRAWGISIDYSKPPFYGCADRRRTRGRREQHTVTPYTGVSSYVVTNSRDFAIADDGERVVELCVVRY